MTITSVALPGTASSITGSNGKIYTAINGIVQCTAQSDVNALTAVGGIIVTYPKGDTGAKGDTGIIAILENAQSDITYTILSGDNSKLLTFNNAAPIAVILPAPAGAFANGFFFYAGNLGVGAATITPVSGAIGGASSLAIAQNECYLIVSNGADYRAIKSAGIA